VKRATNTFATISSFINLCNCVWKKGIQTSCNESGVSPQFLKQREGFPGRYLGGVGGGWREVLGHLEVLGTLSNERWWFGMKGLRRS
jgi:hypothetical protein